MTPQTKKRIRDFGVFVAAALGAVGWGITSSAKFVDHRYVHADTFAILQAGQAAHARDDSTFKASLLSKVDSANLRLQQIVCGRRLSEGCR